MMVSRGTLPLPRRVTASLTAAGLIQPRLLCELGQRLVRVKMLQELAAAERAAREQDYAFVRYTTATHAYPSAVVEQALQQMMEPA